MPGSNSGTGWPLTVRCAKCKRGRDWRRSDTNDTDLVRTGRTKPYNGGNRGARGMSTFHEYRCRRCGHVGWSRHSDIMGKPLEGTTRTATAGRTLTVWGVGLMAYHGLVLPGCAAHQRQVRVIVCAKSQKRAVELINATRFGGHITPGFFRTYGGVTANAIQLRTANNTEGVWWAPLDGPHREDYKKAEPR